MVFSEVVHNGLYPELVAESLNGAVVLVTDSPYLISKYHLETIASEMIISQYHPLYIEYSVSQPMVVIHILPIQPTGSYLWQFKPSNDVSVGHVVFCEVATVSIQNHWFFLEHTLYLFFFTNVFHLEIESTLCFGLFCFVSALFVSPEYLLSSSVLLLFHP